MNKNPNNKDNTRPKSFFGKLFDKLDKKLEEKSKTQSCGCCQPKEKENKSCCS